jgi:hypothetical protein
MADAAPGADASGIFAVFALPGCKTYVQVDPQNKLKRSLIGLGLNSIS